MNSLKTYRTRVKRGPKAVGQTYLLKMLSNEPVTPVQRLRAKCYDCMGFYIDGKVDCQVKECPLYHYMPYKD